MKKNISNKPLNTSLGKSVNERNYISNSHMNTLDNINNTMKSNNFQNYLGNIIEKTKYSKFSIYQEEKNNKSNVQLEYIKDLNRNNDISKNDFNNKSLNNFEYIKKNTFNKNDNKIEKDKNKKKDEISIKKIKSNKMAKNKNNFKKKLTHRQFLNHISNPDDSILKEGNKDNFIKKNSKKMNKIKTSNNTSNNLNNTTNNNLRQSYHIVNYTSSRNTYKLTKNKSKQKKSLTHHSTISDLENKKQEINKNLNKEELIKKLSKREKSYYLLSNSPILRLNERLFFARSTINMRNIQNVADILSKNEIFLNDKIKELNDKIQICDKRINTSFNPSKTAEINFNFILSKDEDEFKNFSLFAENEKEKNEYFIFLKIIYLLFNEKFENIELKNLSGKLYSLISKKGFKTIKEYLYSLFFKKKDTSNAIFNITKINYLIEELKPDKHFNIKFCRFALFISFLFKEIIAYGNDIKGMLELKVRTKELIDVINNKLKLYKAAYSSKKK